MKLNLRPSVRADWSREDLYQLILLTILFASIHGFLLLTGSAYLIYPDAMEYAQTARNLSEGRGAITETLWLLQTAYPLEIPPPDVRRPLLWPAVVSLWMRVLGPQDWVIILASVVMGWLCALVFYALARQVLGPTGSFFSGLVYVLQPQVIAMNHSGLSEPLFTLLLVAIVLMSLKTHTVWHFLIVGLLIGLAQWVRLNGFLLAIPWLGWLIWRRPAKWAACAGGLLAGLGLVVLPMMIRNYVYVGDWSPIGVARYSVVGEIPPFPDHGAERWMERLSVLAVFAAQPGAVLGKFVGGLFRNLSAIFTVVHPILWGLWLIPLVGPHTASLGHRVSSAVQNPDSVSNPVAATVVAISRLTLAIFLLFWLTFSIGEYEGGRFYVPLVPFVVLGGLYGLRWLVSQTSPATAPRQRSRWKEVVVVLLLLLPGVLSASEMVIRPADSSFQQDLPFILSTITEEGSTVGSDIPWAVGWYGRRLSVWLPLEPAEMPRVNRRLKVDYILLSSAILTRDWRMTDWPRVYSGLADIPGYERIMRNQLPYGLALYKRVEESVTAPDSQTLE